MTSMVNMTAPFAELEEIQASLANERGWRNIQQVVQSTFAALTRAMHSQAQQIQALESQLALTHQQHEKQRDELERSTSDAQIVRNEILAHLSERDGSLVARVLAQADARYATQVSIREQVDSSVTVQLRAQWAAHASLWQAKHEEAARHDAQQHQRELDELRKAARAVQRQAHAAQRPRQSSNVEPLACRISELESELHSLQSAITAHWVPWRQRISETLQSRSSEGNAAKKSIDTLVARVDVFEDSTNAKIEHLHEQRCKLDTQAAERSDAIARLQTHVHELVSVAEKLEREQAALKTAVAEQVQTLNVQREMKQGVTRLHEAVKGVRRQVESTAKRADVEALSEQVSSIRRQLRSEMYQARYLWKEGRPTSARQTIAWTSQVVNTSADVFVWQHGSDHVTAMVPGLYHLQAAFFTRFSPMIQVLVNGEPALLVLGGDSDEDSGDFVIDDDDIAEENRNNASNQDDPARRLTTRSSNSRGIRQKTVLKHARVRHRRLHHSAGEIVGVELSAFLALPARAVLAIGYDIDERAQGFLNLRKL